MGGDDDPHHRSARCRVQEPAPQHSRFQKGGSGTPSGRKKAAKEAGENDLDVVLSRKMTMVIDGKKVRLTARRALYQKLLAMGFNNSNLRAIALLLKADSLNDNSAAAQADGLSAADADAIIAEFIWHQGNVTGGGDAC
ncbi:DUF5681 domain-containing protein [Bosea sp. (in: a-proteobacteria)]|uniref:DUF5681 domain-containing protein n=1 Tax=Bosea sp. (in: a-proteobacteria) TaxID=1871050 RepID=UPI0035648624